MDNVNLKREIFRQIKPLNIATQEKLDQLMSDDCFESNRYNYLSQNSPASRDSSDDFAAAFKDTMPKHSDNASYSRSTSDNWNNNQASLHSPQSARSAISRSALDRLNALRGLSSGSIYTKKTN